MEILLVRNNSASWGIDGHLYINRTRICDTAEHPKRHLLAGEYIISSLGAEGSSLSETAHSERLGLPFPFRHGDGALALKHGEIIVGKLALTGLVTQSAETYQRLYERLKKAFQRTPPSASRLEVDSQSEPTSHSCEFVFFCHLTLKPIHSRAICKNNLHMSKNLRTFARRIVQEMNNYHALST